MASSAAQKDVNELIRAVRRNGFKVVAAGSGHYKVLTGKGAKVVDENGPVIISSSASDVRARDMHVKRLLAAGALKADPFKPEKNKDERQNGDGETKSKGFLASEEARLAAKKKAMEVQGEASKRRAERTRKIRGRLEPLVAKLGGWEKSGFKAELGRVFYHYGVSTNRQERSKTLSGAMQNARIMSKGGTLSDDLATMWELLLDDILGSPDPVKRYFDLVRESKGLGSPSKTPPVTEKPAGVTEEQAAAVQEPEPEPHPMVAMHRSTGVSWMVELTLDDLADMNRSLGFLEAALPKHYSENGGGEALSKLNKLADKMAHERMRIGA